MRYMVVQRQPVSSRVMIRLPSASEATRHAIDQVNLSADGEHCARRGVLDKR